MKATEFVGPSKLDTEPEGVFVPQSQRREAIEDALRDVDLGEFDRYMIKWMVGILDETVVQTLVSWLLRVHAAAGDLE